MPTAKEVAAWLQAELAGDPEIQVRDVNAIETARAGDAVFALDEKHLALAEAGPAAVVLAPRNLKSAAKTLLKVDDPKVSFAALVDRLRPPEKPVAGIHAGASVAKDAKLGKGISVGPFAVIESGASIGDGAVIGAGSVVGARASVGAGTVLMPRVVIYCECQLGARCLIHSGAVIGADGFGFATEKDGRHVKIRQLGNVVIGDDVEVGANCTIDRATFGSTTIGDGTKIDKLVHVAHNCRLGKNVLLAGHVGLSGSCEIGDNAILLGQVGTTDHLKIGARAVVMPQSGVFRDVPDGQVVLGSPTYPRREAERQLIAISKLPELLKRVSALEKKLGIEPEPKK